MINRWAGLIVLVALSGCAANYQYLGQKYDSKEKFQQAVDSNVSNGVSVITPLPTALTQRKLVFAIPSEATLFNELVRRHGVLNNGSQPNSLQIEMYENLAKAAYKSMKVNFDAVQKRNIYASTQFVEMQSMNGSFAASPDTDSLYYVEPAVGASQWFYTSLKHGKQVFAYDRSDPNFLPRLQSFVDAAQTQAIRD